MSADAFRRAIEAGDLEGMVDALAGDVVLHSPVTFKPFEGKEAVRKLFAVLLRTFEDFRYTDELHADGLSVLVFETRVGTRQVQGIDLLRYDRDGRIEDFTVHGATDVGRDRSRRGRRPAGGRYGMSRYQRRSGSVSIGRICTSAKPASRAWRLRGWPGASRWRGARDPRTRRRRGARGPRPPPAAGARGTGAAGASQSLGRS